MASPSAYRRRFGSLRQSYALAGRHLLNDLSGVDRRVRVQYMKDRLLQELVAACDAQSLPVIQNRHKHHCLAIWGHGEFRIGLAESVGEHGKYKWVFRTSGWRYPRQPLILGLLSADNLHVDKIGLMFAPPSNRSYFSFHEDVIANTAILKQTAGEIVAAIASKASTSSATVP